MRRIALIFCILFVLGLTACNTAADTPAPTGQAKAVTTAAQTPATPAAAAIATATPTAGLPTPTATPTRRPPTATPLPTSTPTPRIYVVQEFDTLLGIAIEFDTTVEALTAANGLNENDFLQIGQELVIPTAGNAALPAAAAQQAATATRSPATATLAPAESPTSAPVQSQPTAAAEAGPPPQPAPSPEAGSAPPPVTNRPANINPLTGLPVNDPALLRRRPLMVRIGNDVGARQSQVGFNSADMVYEEITEWWVTRFTAIFLAETPPAVGPVRSARLINVQLVPQYQGALAHSGGSDPVRWEISQAPIANLDEFYNPAPYFYRPNQGWQTRLAINTQAARDYMQANGLEAAVSLQGFVFSNTLNTGEPAENIFIPYPRATSFTQWRYDPASGQYLRFVDGATLVDVATGQVTADNVIIYFAEHQETDIVEDSNGATSIRILVNGKGPAWFFRDGKLNKGFWETDGTRTPYFGYPDGRPFPLKPGRTWVEVVPTYFKIGLNTPQEASASP